MTLRQNAAARPLAGIRVIDLSTVMLGPHATQMLGDYGADVVKVEAPQGDSTRSTGPARERGMAATFLGANGSKRRVVLDLKQPQAPEALLALVDRADVLVCSVRGRACRRDWANTSWRCCGTQACRSTHWMHCWLRARRCRARKDRRSEFQPHAAGSRPRPAWLSSHLSASVQAARARSPSGESRWALRRCGPGGSGWPSSAREAPSSFPSRRRPA